MKTAKSLLALILAMLIAFGSFVCASAVEDPLETEDNGSTATADVFGLGTGIKGKLADTDDKDYFAFTSADSGLVTVTIKHDKKTGADPVATYFTVTIFDATGTVEIETFKSKGIEDTKSIDFSANPGTYFVLVEGGNILDTTLEYTLSAKINKTALFEKEPNNIPSQATKLEISKDNNSLKNYYGAITLVNETDEKDIDYYEVTITKDSLVSFGIYNTTSKTGNYKASFIKVVDGINGKPLEKVIGTVTINEGDYLKDSPLFGVGAGVYCLKVEGIGSSTGGYQVRVFAGVTSTKDECEFNNEIKYATKIEAGDTITGNIFDKSDVDMFVLNAPEGNLGYDITISDYNTDREVVNGQWTIEIKDDNGEQIVDKKQVKNIETILSETEPLEKGVYYIIVTSGNVFTGETYKISVAAKKEAITKDEPKKEITTIAELFEIMFSTDWTNFIKNFIEWLPSVNVIGIIADLLPGVVKLLSDLVFSKM